MLELIPLAIGLALYLSVAIGITIIIYGVYNNMQLKNAILAGCCVSVIAIVPMAIIILRFLQIFTPDFK